MTVLARKITRAKWEPKTQLSSGEIAADAVTVDLRTTGNTLSFWRCDTMSKSDLARAVLALAASAERPDKIDLVYVSEESVGAAELATRDTAGDTPIASLREYHVNIEKLDYVRLGIVAGLIVRALETSAFLRLPKNEVVSLLVEAVRSELVAISDLRGNMKETVLQRLSEG